MYEPVLTDEKLDLYNVYEVHKNYRILAMAVNVPLQVAEEICHILNNFEPVILKTCPICDQSVTINEYISDYLYSINCECCCENWGYLSSEDDFGSFIGSELKNVYVTDSELGTIVSNMKEDLDAGSAMFINVETTRGLLQFAAYNEHNGYYGHDVRLVSKYDDKTVIEADDVL